MRLIFHESIHFFVALIIAILIYSQYKSWKLVIIIFTVSFLLDIDHVIDLVAANGKLQDIITGHYFSISQKAYVLLHSFELLIPWWIYIICCSHPKTGRIYPAKRAKACQSKLGLGWAVSLAFVSHLLIDQFSYNTSLLTYFLTYRIMNGFELTKLFGL